MLVFEQDLYNVGKPGLAGAAVGRGKEDVLPLSAGAGCGNAAPAGRSVSGELCESAVFENGAFHSMKVGDG